MKKRLLSLVTTLVMIFSFTVFFSDLTLKAGAAGLSLEDLQRKFPNGMYWNHVVNNYNERGDVLLANGDNSTADTVTDRPCQTHNGQPEYGNCDCNVFDRSMQCCGFAKKLAFDVYGSHTYEWGTTKDINTVKPGDVIHYTGGNAYGEHWVFVIGVEGNAITVGECNSASNLCQIRWGNVIYKGGFSVVNIYSAPYALPTHSHSYTGAITTQPTCTAAGVMTYTCTCGASYTESIPAKGHSYEVSVVPPTLTEKGYTLHKCSVCGDSFKDNYIDPPKKKADGWYYCDVLPGNVSSDKYIVEYDNIYVKTQKDPPGADWTNAGVVKNEWENSGGQYTSEAPLETSDARVLVKECFYHWCIPGAGMGSEGNYEQTSKFSHYDEIVLPNEWIHVTATGNDEGHTYYLLAWTDGNAVYCKSGEQCDGSYGYHDYRCRAWYKHYVYQDRVKVELYKYTKDSGWVSTKDSAADKVSFRYKPKDSTSGYKLGDVNGDGTVDIEDAVMVIGHVNGSKALSGAESKRADVDGNSNIDIEDAVAIISHVNGIKSLF